jgi:hypothetical protein
MRVLHSMHLACATQYRLCGAQAYYCVTADQVLDTNSHHCLHCCCYCYCSGRPQRLLFSATFPPEVLELAKRAIPKPINEITLASNEELMLEEIYQCWIDLRHDGANGRVELLRVSTSITAADAADATNIGAGDLLLYLLVILPLSLMPLLSMFHVALALQCSSHSTDQAAYAFILCCCMVASTLFVQLCSTDATTTAATTAAAATAYCCTGHV